MLIISTMNILYSNTPMHWKREIVECWDPS